MKIVFRYHNEPTNNFLGTDGSSDAVTLFDNGIVRYEHFLFCRKEPDRSTEHGPYTDLPAAVLNIIAEYNEDIASFPAFIDNNCCDGSWQHFQLGEKQITVDNMCFHSAEDIHTIRLLNGDNDKLSKILLAVNQTNTMVIISRKIASAFFEHCVAKSTTNQSTTISPKTQDKF